MSTSNILVDRIFIAKDADIMVFEPCFLFPSPRGRLGENKNMVQIWSNIFKLVPSWDPRAAHPWAIDGPSHSHRWPIDGPPTFLPWPIDGPSMGHRWDHSELPSMGYRNFCQGIKNTFLRDFYEKKTLEISKLHYSISSRECSECKKCIRNRLTDSQIQSITNSSISKS